MDDIFEFKVGTHKTDKGFIGVFIFESMSVETADAYPTREEALKVIKVKLEGFIEFLKERGRKEGYAVDSWKVSIQ